MPGEHASRHGDLSADREHGHGAAYELVTRRRANPKIESMVHMGGIMVLGVLMILVTLHDFHVF